MRFPLAIIPAAGMGSRMGKLTEDGTPKCLLPVNGVPMIVHVVRFWADYAEKIVVVVVPDKRDAFVLSLLSDAQVQDYLRMGGVLEAVIQHAPLGAPNAVWQAFDQIGYCPKRFIVALGDCLFDGKFTRDPRTEVDRHWNRHWKCGVAVMDDSSDMARSYAVDRNGGPMVEKPAMGLGAYFFTWYALSAFRGTVGASMTDVMERLRVTEGVELRRFEGRYLNATTPEDLERWA